MSRMAARANHEGLEVLEPPATSPSVGGTVIWGPTVGVAGVVVGVALGADTAVALGVGVVAGATPVPLVIDAEQMTRLPPPFAEPLH